MKQWNALFILALVPLVGCADRAAQQSAKKTQELVTDPTIPVTTQPSRLMNLAENLEVTGAFATSEESTVGASIAGRLVGVFVRDGDPVRAGQSIAQLETQDMSSRLRQARAQAEAARATLQQAQSDAMVAPSKSDANIRAAQARLSQSRARYAKAKNGSRSEERAQAEWTVKRTKSDMDTAKAALDRANRLFAEGAIAKVDVETAENRYTNTLAAYEAALQSLSMVQSATRPEDLQAALDDVRAAEESLRLAQADKRLDVNYQQRVSGARANLNSALDQVALAQKAFADATVRSPFSGRVSGKPLQAGTFVAPGTTIATVIGGSGTYFEASVPESRVALINPGLPVDVTIDALKGAKVTGTVVAVNPVASGQGRVFTVRVSVNESIGVKPGMFARGSIKLGQRTDAVVVPSIAIIRDGETTYLFVIESNTAKRVEVKLGLQNGDFQEVTGLKTGQQVAVTGQTNLVEGSKVSVQGDKKVESDKKKE